MKQQRKQRPFGGLRENQAVETIRAALPITGRYLRSPEAAAYLGVTVATVRDWAEKRILKAYHPTRRLLLFKVAELDADMEAHASKRS